MDIKLIAFDLDGTLLRPDKTISPRTQAALEAANAKGVLLVPATGRLFIALPPELQDAALVRYMILINGASIYDSKTKQILTRTEMDLPQAERMHAYMQTLPALCGFYQNDQGWMSSGDYAQLPQVMPSAASASVLQRAYLPTEHFDAQLHAAPSIQKMIVYFRDLEKKFFYLDEMTEKFPDYAVSSSIINNIEVNAKLATKGDALAKLCAMLDIPIAQCMAFGDDTNDCSMLRAAGLGVAMGNASDAVKACADAVAESNEEDGLARMIEQVLGL